MVASSTKIHSDVNSSQPMASFRYRILHPKKFCIVMNHCIGPLFENQSIYKEILEDCGKNPSDGSIKQDFLFALKEKGQGFLKKK